MSVKDSWSARYAGRPNSTQQSAAQEFRKISRKISRIDMLNRQGVARTHPKPVLRDVLARVKRMAERYEVRDAPD